MLLDAKNKVLRLEMPVWWLSNERRLLGYKLIHNSKQRWVLGDRACLGLDPIGHSARGKASSAERR